MREPDPMLVDPPVLTTTRQLLERWLHTTVEGVKLRYDRDIDKERQAVQELTARVVRLTDELAAAQRELQDVVDRRPDPGDAVRKRGEQEKSDAIVRARRQREYERRCARARAARDALEETLRQCTEAVAAADVRITGLERSKVDEAYRLRAAYSHADAVYVRALLRRHPEREVLRHVLDRSPLPLPSWAQREGDDVATPESVR